MNEQLIYENFDLLIRRWDGAHYQTHLLHSPDGECRGVLSLATHDVITNLRSLRRLVLDDESRNQTNEQRWQHARQLGSLLFDALMSGDIRSSFDVSLSLVRHVGKGLRIRLRIDPAELVSLPWELMFDRRTDYFLSLSNQTPIVRYIEIKQNSLPLKTLYPLQILVVVSNPVDQAPLDTEAEVQRIRRALGHLEQAGKVRLTMLHSGNIEVLQRHLRLETYHVLHYAGHGQYSAHDGEGYLVFEDNQRRSYTVNGRRLGMLLRDEQSLRLVVLNACSTAQHADTDPFSGVASALVQAGSAAVLAMQTSVTDEAALRFAGTFYDALSEGCPIDMAVAEGRKSIEFLSNYSVDWAIPQLYMRVPDGVLFRLPADTSAPAKSRPMPPVASDALRSTTGPATDQWHKLTGQADHTQRDSVPLPSLEGTITLPSTPATDSTTTPDHMRFIPASEFIYSAGTRLYLPAFWIDTYPVTNADYLRYVEATNARRPPTWQNGLFPRAKADHPITGVSWHDAAAYAQWAGKRLPTAAEWEKAARGTDGQRYPWGNEFEAHRCNTYESGWRGTTPVNFYPSGVSPFSVFDMVGNVLEWVADEVKPRGLGSAKTKRALKGSSWNDQRSAAECSAVSSDWPESQRNYIGFRCARSG